MPEEEVSNQGIDNLMSAMSGIEGAESSIQELSALKGPSEAPAAESQARDTNLENTEEVFSDLLGSQAQGQEDPSEQEEGAQANTEEGQESAEAVNVEEGAEAQEGEDPSEEEEEEDYIENPLIGGKKVLGTKKPKDSSEAVNFEGSEEFNEYISKNFGIEKPETFFESTKKWRKDSQALGEAEAITKNYESVLNGIPAQLYGAIKTFYDGGDWMNEISSTTHFDFTKDADSIDSQKLVEKYSSEEISSEDWEDYRNGDADDNTKRLIDVVIKNSKSAYNSEKSKFDNLRANSIKEAEEKDKLFKASLSGSVESLKQVFPEISDTYASNIENRILGGDIQKLFFDESGNLKKDALQRFVMASDDGIALLEQYKRVANNRAESNANQELLERTPNTPPRNVGSQTTKKRMTKEQSDMMKMFDGLDDTRTYE